MVVRLGRGKAREHSQADLAAPKRAVCGVVVIRVACKNRVGSDLSRPFPPPPARVSGLLQSSPVALYPITNQQRLSVRTVQTEARLCGLERLDGPVALLDLNFVVARAAAEGETAALFRLFFLVGNSPVPAGGQDAPQAALKTRARMPLPQ